MFDEQCGADQDDSQEDVMTPAQLIAKLEEVSEHLDGGSLGCYWCDWCSVLCPLHRQAWLNERFSPELLENKSEVVECVMEQLTHMVNSQGNTCCCCSRKCQRAL